MDQALAELLEHRVVARTSSRTPSGSLFLNMSNGKVTVIFDLRAYNFNQSHRPPSAPLATVEHLIEWLRRPPTTPSTTRYFTKIDLSRCYDSLVLPADGPHFYFCYRDATYRYLRVPFGWCDAPYIVQKMMISIVREAAIETSTPTAAFVYIDDVLVASDDPADAERFTTSIIRVIRRRGLKVNMTKTIRRATSTVDFLGYTICAPRYDDTWIQSSSSSTISLPGLRPVSAKQAVVLAGALLWRCPLTLPFVAPLYYHVGGRLNHAVAQLLSSAASLAARARRYVPGRWTSVPARTHDINHAFFCDANATTGLAACVLPDGTSRTWRIPSFITSSRHHTRQQIAELYALSRTVRLAFSRSRTATIVSDSASALASMLRLSPRRSFLRGLLLRQTAYLRADHPRHDFIFAFVRSEWNPADPLTHASQRMDWVAARLANLHFLDPVPGIRRPDSYCPGVIECETQRVPS
jgi:hypothetical protein